jgi:MFS family permease
MSFIVLTTIIPGASTMVAKYAPHTTSRTKDKRLTQISCLLLLIGSLTMFLAASPALVILGTIIAALGSSFNVTAKSFVTVLIPPDDFGAVYTGITVATYGGVLSSGPLFAHTFHYGLRLWGFWMGLPFLVASGLFLLCLVALSLVDGF